MNLLGSFDMFMAICDDAGIIISLFILFIFIASHGLTVSRRSTMLLLDATPMSKK